MAVELQGFDIGFLKASTDLSAYQHHGVKISATNFTAEPATAVAVDGILQNKPAAAGRACQIRISGVSKVELGGAVTAGNKATTDLNGKLIATTTNNDRFVGTFLEAGDSGDTVTMLVEPGYLPGA